MKTTKILALACNQDGQLVSAIRKIMEDQLCTGFSLMEEALSGNDKQK
jgi:hypothetical protein